MYTKYDRTTYCIIDIHTLSARMQKTNQGNRDNAKAIEIN